MTRDMDTVRKILLHVEQASEPVEQVSGIPAEIFSYHAALLMEAGLIEGDFAKDSNLLARDAVVFRLTWSGHDFLDAARDDTVWRTAKEKVLKLGASWTFDLLKEMLKALAKQQLTRIGLPDFNT